MVPLTALWLPILLSAVIVFVASSIISHGAPHPQKRLPQAARGRQSARDATGGRRDSGTDLGQQSSLVTRLAANENTGFFLGMVKPQPEDISIVENAGTFLMWYDNG